MNEIECPYCGWTQEADTDSVEKENDIGEQECSCCKALFAVTMSITVDYYAHKATCMNTGVHDYSPVYTTSAVHTKMRCRDCGVEITKPISERKNNE